MFCDIVSLVAACRMVMEECLTSHGTVCSLKSYREKILRRQHIKAYYRQYCNFAMMLD